MSDTTLPLTIHEYDEWGNMTDPEVFQAVSRYDPYRNLDVQRYPFVFLTASLLDQRVPYWNALKYAAKLQHLLRELIQRDTVHIKGEKECDVILLVDHETGHAGEGGRYSSMDAKATEAALLVEWIEGNCGKRKE